MLKTSAHVSMRARYDRQIVVMAKRQCFQSAVPSTKSSETQLLVEIARTFCNRLHDAGIHSRRPVARTPLTPRHRRNRLVLVRDHFHWQRRHYRPVLFTEE